MEHKTFSNEEEVIGLFLESLNKIRDLQKIYPDVFSLEVHEGGINSYIDTGKLEEHFKNKINGAEQ